MFDVCLESLGIIVWFLSLVSIVVYWYVVEMESEVGGCEVYEVVKEDVEFVVVEIVLVGSGNLYRGVEWSEGDVE